MWLLCEWLTPYQGCLWVSRMRYRRGFFELSSGVAAGLTRYSYVGNTMAALVMQTLGCDVAALNTVHFSKSQLFTISLVY